MSSHGTQRTSQSRYGCVLKVKRHTRSTCSSQWSYRVEDRGSNLLRQTCVSLDIPLPQHQHGYCRAELKAFVKARALNKFLRWMYGQTCMVEGNEPVYYTYDVMRWLKLAIYGTPTIWD